MEGLIEGGEGGRDAGGGVVSESDTEDTVQ